MGDLMERVKGVEPSSQALAVANRGASYPQIECKERPGNRISFLRCRKEGSAAAARFGNPRATPGDRRRGHSWPRDGWTLVGFPRLM